MLDVQLQTVGGAERRKCTGLISLGRDIYNWECNRLNTWKPFKIYPHLTKFNHASFNFFEKCNPCVSHAKIIIWDDPLVTLSLLLLLLLLLYCYFESGSHLAPITHSLVYNSLWRPGWPQICWDPPACSPLLREKVCATTPGPAHFIHS